MGGLPDILFVIDTNKEAIAVQEATKLGIPVVAILDSNCDPRRSAYPFPGNDDASRAIKLYCDLAVAAVLDGLQAEMSASGIDVGEIEDLGEIEELPEVGRRRGRRCGRGAGQRPERAAPAQRRLRRRLDPRPEMRISLSMAEITAALVKELRENTGAGMMDCKRALGETGGDIEAATDWLRKKGLAAAAKKAGRVAAEGLIGIALTGTAGALVEVNAETDFVARNESSRRWSAGSPALAPAAKGDLEALQAARIAGTGRTVDEEITQAIAVIGENINLRRTAYLEVAAGRRRRLCAQPAGAGPRQARRAGGAGVDRPTRRGWPSSASSSPCMSRPPTRRRSSVDAARPGRGRARACDLRRSGARVGQAREHHREDGRGAAAQVLRGSGAARAGLRRRHRQARQGGGPGGRPRSWARRSRSWLRPHGAGRGGREG